MFRAGFDMLVLDALKAVLVDLPGTERARFVFSPTSILAIEEVVIYIALFKCTFYIVG